jgi:hypothetical protein
MVGAGGAIFNRRQPKSRLNWIYNSKLGHFTSWQIHIINTPSSRDENSAQLGKV